MKDSEIYLRAAELIDSDAHEYSCLAVNAVAGYFLNSPQSYRYIAAMPLTQTNLFKLWKYKGNKFNITPGYRQHREHRVYMLLLMAQIAKDDEK